MPRRPDFILQTSIRNIEDFSPDAIVKSPRSFRPTDLRNACANIALTPSKGTPPQVMAIAQYIASEFFVLAHSSGLFNRQIKLWESLAKTQTIEIIQSGKGLFSQEKLPEYDLSFLDHKNRCLLFAHMAMPAQSGANFDYLKSAREFLKRASMIHGLNGVFICFPGPFPTKVLEFVKKETNARDTVARFESIYPKLGVPLNLIEVDQSSIYNPTEQCEVQKFRLVLPDLSKKKLGGTNMPAADMNMLNDEDYS